jgi:hypothetical protein
LDPDSPEPPEPELLPHAAAGTTQASASTLAAARRRIIDVSLER